MTTKKGSIRWEQRGDAVAVWFYAEVPCDEAPAFIGELQRIEQTLRPPTIERPASRPPVNRSFGHTKLPPGSRSGWVAREWMYFTLWVLTAGTLFVAALWKNLHFFW
jgi:hypothetical protein